MNIDGPQQKQLNKALLSAFPTRDELEMMVLYQLNENLSTIVESNNLQNTVFKLIRWAATKGRVEELVDAALKQNSKNTQLISIAKQLTEAHDMSDEEGRENEKRSEKETRLRSMFIDQHDFVQDRLQRFVGREAELTVLRERITGQMKRGGYVIITGDAGNGKSSIIAKLIAEQGLESCAYHFIQSNAGPGHQIGILRNLMARLILKYDLPEHYVTGESYPILRDCFRRVLSDIAAKGAREVIFIDGLDQLELDSSASRHIDTSFLPSPLLPGIVIVVGTRPNTTLGEIRRVTNTWSNDPYRLEGLSHEDFDLLLRTRGVPLLPALSDSLYLNLNRNALYLDLAAQALLMQPNLKAEELIARLANNPDHIFTVTFSRMQHMSEWYDVIRPILGILLVAQEPLTSQQIAHISNKESVRIRAGIIQLGGLLTLAGPQRYALFHPMLSLYLKHDAPDNAIQFSTEEVEELHAQVARWCEQGTIEQLWQDVHHPSLHDNYREYTQKHYITHLYHARRYEQLFTVLHQGDYERGKLRFDRSTRATAADLKLGCQAAAREATTLAQGKVLLSHLWRYTLLRTNLTTQADAYSLEAFQALLALGREREAFDLAELLTQPARKLEVLILLTEYLLQQPTREAEGIQLYARVYEIATSIEDSQIQTRALSDLTKVLLHAGQLTRAEDIARSIADHDVQAVVLSELSDAYGRLHNWQMAEQIARAIALPEELIRTLSNLAATLKCANEDEQAETLWQEASAKIPALAESDQRDRANYQLSVSFMQAREWERAATVAQSIESSVEKVRTLCQLALSFTQAGLAARAETAWEEAQLLVSITTEDKRDKAQSIYAIAQVQGGFSSEAEIIARRKINSSVEKISVFSSLASNLIRGGLWEHSKRIIDLIVKEYDLIDVGPPLLDATLIQLSLELAHREQWNQARETARMIPTQLSLELAHREQWNQARETARMIPRKEAPCRALMGIVTVLAQAGLHEMAQVAWEEARAKCTAQMDAVQTSVTSTVVSVLVETGQLTQAKKMIPTLPDKQAQERVMEEMAIALARTGAISEAEAIARETTNPQRQASIQQSIAIAQMKAGQSQQAIATAQALPYEAQRVSVLGELVAILCQRQQWNIAQEIARQIHSEHSRADLIRHIVVGLVQAGKIKEAEAIARSIGNDFLREHMMCDLATMLARMKYFAKAEKVVRTLKNPRIQEKALSNMAISGLFGVASAEPIAVAMDRSSERDEALYNVALAYSARNAWAEAEKVVGEIDGEQKRDAAWSSIAREYARAELWIAAISALDKIKDEKQRVKFLQSYGTLVSESYNKEIIGKIVDHLNNSQERASLLVSIADALAHAGRYPELIHLTQQAWLQASSKDDCESLFAMLRGLLVQHTELCIDFHESFTWVALSLNE